MVRAKFRCDGKTDDSVTLHPVTGGSPENDSYFSATPGGEIRLQVLNERAVAAFEVGKEYYVDFSPAEIRG